MFIAEDVTDLLRARSFYAAKEHKTDFYRPNNLSKHLF